MMLPLSVSPWLASCEYTERHIQICHFPRAGCKANMMHQASAARAGYQWACLQAVERVASPSGPGQWGMLTGHPPHMLISVVTRSGCTSRCYKPTGAPAWSRAAQHGSAHELWSAEYTGPLPGSRASIHISQKHAELGRAVLLTQAIYI